MPLLGQRVLFILVIYDHLLAVQDFIIACLAFNWGVDIRDVCISEPINRLKRIELAEIRRDV